MPSSQPFIDEYTLAAFLAGTLPEKERADVMAYLAANEDARELVCMAQEAYDAAHTPVAAPYQPPPAADKDAEPPHRTDRSPKLSSKNRRLGMYLLSTLLVLVLGVGLYQTLAPAPDLVRGSDAAGAWVAEVSGPALHFQWAPVPEAYYYRLLITDDEAGVILAQHETRSTRLDSDDAFMVSLAPRLEPHRSYSLYVDAIDAQNRRLQSTPPETFRLPE